MILIFYYLLYLKQMNLQPKNAFKDIFRNGFGSLLGADSNGGRNQFSPIPSVYLRRICQNDQCCLELFQYAFRQLI